MKERTAAALERCFSLEGRVGILTGQSGGIGWKVSCLLADAGATVYGFNRTVRPEKDWPGVTQLHVDINDPQAIQAAVSDIGQREGLDFLINNAGITCKKRAERITPEEWRSVQQTNVDSLFQLCQAAYPYLKKSAHGGRIVNIASMAAHMGFSQVVPYCASKSAVDGVTRGLAVEWVDDGILVNSVSPGWFPSQMNQAVLAKDPERGERILSKIAMKRYGDPEELAAMILFLLGDGAKYITGQDFAVDGGALAYGY